MGSIDTLVEFAKYGIWGVMVLLIGAVVFSQWMLYKVVTNHLEHSDETIGENTKAISALNTVIREALILNRTK